MPSAFPAPTAKPIAAARAAGIPVFERAQAWGEIMKSYKNAICISGTHGKTTTTAMMTHILMEADMDPTVMIGGYLPLLHAGHRVGHGDTIVVESCEYCDSFLNFFPTLAVVLNVEADHLDYFKDLHAGHRVGHGDTIVVESCEYCDSFLNFFPTLAVVLNVEADHLDYFKDLEDIQKSFHEFASLATFGVIANGDDPHTVAAMEGISYVSFGLQEGNQIRAANMHPNWQHFDVICQGEFYCHLDMGVMGMEGISYVSFGLQEGNQIRAANMHPNWQHFDVICQGEFYCHLDMGVMGKHNAMNALAAAAAAWMMGIPGEAVAEGLKSFHGAGRRMEFKGTFQGADVYDDYAHHPDEVSATISAVRASMPGRRLVLAFQPHTYTRTQALFADFVRELKKPDVLVLAEIYAARERNTIPMKYRPPSAPCGPACPAAAWCWPSSPTPTPAPRRCLPTSSGS